MTLPSRPPQVCSRPLDESRRSSAGQSLRRATLGATVVSAVAASICCIGPLAAALLGVTGLGAFVAFEKYRSYLAGITLIFLAGAFYVTYRKKPGVPESCEPGSLCAAAGTTRLERANRIVLWVVTAVVVLVLTFPTWSGWIWG